MPQKKPIMESHATFTTRSVCCNQAGGGDKRTKTDGLTADEHGSAAVAAAMNGLIRQHHAVRARHAMLPLKMPPAAYTCTRWTALGSSAVYRSVDMAYTKGAAQIDSLVAVRDP